MYSTSGMAMASLSVNWAAVFFFQLCSSLASLCTTNCGGGASTGADMVKLVLAAVDTSIARGAMLEGLTKPDLEVLAVLVAGPTTEPGLRTTGAALAAGCTTGCTAGLPADLAEALAAGAAVLDGVGATLGGAALAAVLAAGFAGVLAEGLDLAAPALAADLTGAFTTGLATGFVVGLAAAFTDLAGTLDLDVTDLVGFAGLALPAWVAGLAFNFSAVGAALEVALRGDLEMVLAAALAIGFLTAVLLAGVFAGFFATGLTTVFFSAGALAFALAFALTLATGFFTGLDFFAGAFTTYLLAKPAALGTALLGWWAVCTVSPMWGDLTEWESAADCSHLPGLSSNNLKIKSAFLPFSTL